MNFFFDAQSNVKLARCVAQLTPQHTFQVLKDHFPHGTADEVWIPAVKSRDEPWIVISGDNRRFESKAQCAVLHDSGLTWVALMGKFNNRLFDEQVQQLVEAWPRLVNLIEKQREPFIYKVKLDPNRRKGEDFHRVLVEKYRAISELLT